MEWKWAKANEKDLARFVNEKAIQLLDKLPVEDRLKLLSKPSGRRKVVEAIYQTLAKKGIRYDIEKYQPEAETQHIRTPVEILNTPGEGTCLDLAILFCSLCFGYDLLPLLILIEGHAFAAVSLTHSRHGFNDDEHKKGWDDFRRTVFDTTDLFQGEENLAKLQKLVKEESYIAVECTGFTRSQSLAIEGIPRQEGGISFEDAVVIGEKNLNNPNKPFKFAIDIAAAKYIWKIPTEEIPNFDKARERAKAVFNVNVNRQDGGEVIGVEAKKVNSGRDLEANVNIKKADQARVVGGSCEEL